MKKYIKLLFASTQSQVRSKRGVAMTKTRRLLMTAAATSCLVAAGGCYHYYVNGGNVFPVLMAAETAASVNSEISDETERRRKCSQLVKQFKEKNGAPCVVVAVTKDSNLVYSKGFGYADVENCVRAHPHTVIRIASISKPITCLVAAKLWEQGKLDVDKPISTYLPDVPALKYKGKPTVITTRQLMAHTSGIRHYKETIDENCQANSNEHLHSEKSYKDSSCGEFYINRTFRTTRDALSLFLNDELLFEPGKGYLYSTFGYTMLSAVLESASKDTPFPKLLTELFRRMDMNETYLDVNDAIVPYRAKYYLRDANKRLVNVPYVDVSYKYGGGGILSNVYDLCKLGNNLIASYQDCNDGTRKLLKASTMRNQVWATQSNPERCPHRDLFFDQDFDVTYGLGWNLCFDKKKELRYVYHTGGAVGATSCLLIVPPEKNAPKETASGIVVAVLCNAQDVGDIVKFSYNIARIYDDNITEI